MKSTNQIKSLLLFFFIFINIAYFSFQFIIENSNLINEYENNEGEYNRSSTIVHLINGKKYLAEIISEEKVEEMKITNNININGEIDNGFRGTGALLPNENDLNNLVGHLMILEEYKEENLQKNLKTSAVANDLSNETYFPQVRSQGSQGSCASWSVVYYSMGYLEAKDNGWDASSGNESCLLSPAWAYNKLAVDNSGSTLFENAEILKQWGAATLAAMPYNPFDFDSWGNSTAWNEAPYHRALDYNLITFNAGTIINTIKSIIDGGTPVSFCLNSSEYNDGFADSNYIISSLEYNLPSITIDHANTIVGYNDSISDDGDLGAFKVVNSWGTGFADNGYYWLTYEAFKEIQGWGGILYLEDRIDYQPTLIANWTFSSAPTRMDDIITLGVGPYGSAYSTIIPDYYNDNLNFFPTYMTLDISEFYAYYSVDPDINFFLSIGASSISGTISSFKIKKYNSSGVLVETTNESPDVPTTNPGYVTNHFSNIHLLSNPTILTPNGGEIIYSRHTIIWAPAIDSWGHSVTYEVQYSVNGSAWISLATGLMINSYLWDVITIGYSSETLIKVIAYCSGGLIAEDQSDALFTIFPYEQKIPGYDLFLFMGIISITTIILSVKQYKKKDKN
ncbi:MAG: C1 family peptidase [Promethearchaeota archaeon]